MNCVGVAGRALKGDTLTSMARPKPAGKERPARRYHTKFDDDDSGMVRCGRCWLLGHTTEDCDLGTVSDYARRIYDPMLT